MGDHFEALDEGSLEIDWIFFPHLIRLSSVITIRFSRWIPRMARESAMGDLKGNAKVRIPIEVERGFG